ncbi:MAG: Rrf2 family transcriptional regulator [Firmicutes bacterium]|nr:Rrf2 family transcriptional regulator [Bacillota bacterium]
MRISTRGEYGLRAMLDLAIHGGEEPVPLKQIAVRQGISEHYLEQLMGGLRKAGLVTSVRGAQGGYRLAADAREMTAGQILRVLEGSGNVPFGEPASAAPSPDPLTRCATRHLWQQLAGRINELLDSVSLADLLAAAEEARAREGAYMYHI